MSFVPTLFGYFLGIPSLGDCGVRVVGKMSKDMGDESP